MVKTLVERQRELRDRRQAAGLARLEVWVPKELLERLAAVLRPGEARDGLVARLLGRVVRELERRRRP